MWIKCALWNQKTVLDGKVSGKNSAIGSNLKPLFHWVSSYADQTCSRKFSKEPYLSFNSNRASLTGSHKKALTQKLLKPKNSSNFTKWKECRYYKIPKHFYLLFGVKLFRLNHQNYSAKIIKQLLIIYIMLSDRNRRRSQGRRFSDKLGNYLDMLHNFLLRNHNGFYRASDNTF